MAEPSNRTYTYTGPISPLRDGPVPDGVSLRKHRFSGGRLSDASARMFKATFVACLLVMLLNAVSLVVNLAVLAQQARLLTDQHALRQRVTELEAAP